MTVPSAALRGYCVIVGAPDHAQGRGGDGRGDRRGGAWSHGGRRGGVAAGAERCGHVAPVAAPAPPRLMAHPSAPKEMALESRTAKSEKSLWASQPIS